jgi:hypothetical protein
MKILFLSALRAMAWRGLAVASALLLGVYDRFDAAVERRLSTLKR